MIRRVFLSAAVCLALIAWPGVASADRDASQGLWVAQAPPPPPPPPPAPPPPPPRAKRKGKAKKKKAAPAPAQPVPTPSVTPPPPPPPPAEPAIEDARGDDVPRVIIVEDEPGAQSPGANSQPADPGSKPPIIIDRVGPGTESAPPQEPPQIVIVPDAQEPEAKAEPPVPDRPGRWSHWDHLCVEYHVGILTGVLNDAGDRGWILTGFDVLEEDPVICFKRPAAGSKRN